MNPLLIRRRGMMMARQGGLPYDAEVEYIESTGTQYINTNVTARTATHIIAKLYDFFVSSNFGKWPFGGRDSTSTCFGFYINGNTGQVTLKFQALDIGVGYYTSFVGENEIELKNTLFRIGNSNFTFNNVSFATTREVILFGVNLAGTKSLCNAKFGNVWITDGITTRDLIPVRVGTVGYMYDRVSGQLFGNAGTGDFILGPDIQ